MAEATPSSPEVPPQVRDEFAPAPVLDRRTTLDGMIWSVVRESVDLGAGGVVQREYVDHPGAVSILVLDDRERVLLQRQYRHPVGMALWELPAGLLDVTGEPAVEAARRELLEEADLLAGRWHVLMDWFSSPGGSSEAQRCFIARDLSEVPAADRHQRHAEELSLVNRWVPLDEAHELVLAGGLNNVAAIIGVLTARAARDAGWATLRPADAPWPQHPAQA